MNHRYAGQVDEIEYGAYTIRIKWHYEEGCETPWDFDRSGIVSDWERRDKSPGEMILCEDRGSKRFYDFAGNVAALRRDGCSGEQAAAIAMQTFKRWQSWCNEQWGYLWAEITIPGTDYHDSLGMIESDGAVGVIDDLVCEAKGFIDAEYRKMVVDYRLLTLA